ncbi:MAG: diacylglycerol/lipid kinase family protein [Acidimicrobiia bacterium]
MRLRRWAVTAGALGLAAGWVRKVVLPRRPDDAALPIPRRIPDPDARPAPDGTGVRIVVNPSSGPAWRSSPTEPLRTGLPGADIHELDPDEDLEAVISEGDLVAVGAAGGDGTLGAVAVLAAERGLPLVAVPAGTLNHLARDLGLADVDDAIAAVRAGTFAHMDLGTVGDRCFVNTLTFGGYTTLVDTRERLESRIGKWPALAVALLWELPRMQPLRVEVDGEPMRVWVAWIGNCAYDPPGLGPAWRESLEDGLLDVRLIHGRERYSRTRFALHVLTGRLSTCPVYEERTTTSLRIRSLEGPLRLAADGETFDAGTDLEVGKRPRALLVAVPPNGDQATSPRAAEPIDTGAG